MNGPGLGTNGLFSICGWKCVFLVQHTIHSNMVCWWVLIHFGPVIWPYITLWQHQTQKSQDTDKFKKKPNDDTNVNWISSWMTRGILLPNETEIPKVPTIKTLTMAWYVYWFFTFMKNLHFLFSKSFWTVMVPVPVPHIDGTWNLVCVWYFKKKFDFGFGSSFENSELVLVWFQKTQTGTSD